MCVRVFVLITTYEGAVSTNSTSCSQPVCPHSMGLGLCWSTQSKIVYGPLITTPQHTDEVSWSGHGVLLS